MLRIRATIRIIGPILFFLANASSLSGQAVDSPSKRVYRQCFRNHDFQSCVEVENFVSQNLEFDDLWNGESSLEILKGLAHEYWDANMIDKCVVVEEVIVREVRERQGENSKSHVIWLGNLAECRMTIGDFETALELELAAFENCMQISTIDSSWCDHGLSRISNVLQALGRYEEALEYDLTYLAWKKKAIDESPEDYALALLNLSAAYLALGMIAEARDMITKCIEFCDQNDLRGVQLEVLGNLVLLEKEQGNLIDALNFGDEYVEGCRTYYGANHSNYFDALSILANVHNSLGNHVQALALHSKCLDGRKRLFGKSSYEYFESILNIGSTYGDLEKFDEALEYDQESVELCEKLYGPNDELCYDVKLNLAATWSDLGENRKSLELFDENLLSIESSYGVNCIESIGTLQNMASAYADFGMADSAVMFSRQALSILETNGDYSSRDYSDLLYNLTWQYALDNQYHEATSSAQLWLDINRNELLVNERTLDFESREGLYQEFVHQASRFTSLYVAQDKQSPYQYWLNARNRDMNNSLFVSSVIATSIDINSVDSAWSGYKRKLGQLARIEDLQSSDLIGYESVSELRQDMLLREREALSAMDSLVPWSQWVTPKELSAKLAPDEALIDIIFIPPTGLDTTFFYGAFLLTAEDSLAHFIKLGVSEDFQYGLDLYHKYTTSISADAELYAGECYKLFWQPFEPYLHGKKKVLFVPDGVYQELNPYTFYNSAEEQYLIHEYEIGRVSGGLDLFNQRALLLTNDKNGLNDNAPFLLVGNPKFSMNKIDLSRDRSESQLLTREEKFSVNPISEGPIASLPGTEVELNGLSALITGFGHEAAMLEGKKASEAALKTIHRPTVLHLATHGYVGAPWEEPKAGRNESFRLSELNQTTGMILAGAQDVWNKGVLIDGENGWINANEASALDLIGTKLVVLSACNTGFGAYIPGRSSFGMQRAMKTAGAQSVVSSLWEVGDEATSQLMGYFYASMLEGHSVSSSIRKAELELRRTHPHPNQWGAWTVLGDASGF